MNFGKRNQNKTENTVLEYLKFWIYDKIGKSYFKIFVFTKGRIMKTKSFELTQIDPISMFSHIFTVDLERAIINKNVLWLLYDLNNTNPLEVDLESLKIGKAKNNTNKDLSVNIDQKIMSKLFSINPIYDIIPILVSAASLGGVMYLIIILSNVS